VQSHPFHPAVPIIYPIRGRAEDVTTGSTHNTLHSSTFQQQSNLNAGNTVPNPNPTQLVLASNSPFPPFVSPAVEADIVARPIPFNQIPLRTGTPLAYIMHHDLMENDNGVTIETRRKLDEDVEWGIRAANDETREMRRARTGDDGPQYVE